MANDVSAADRASRSATGLTLAVLSAFAFGLSGALASSLFAVGWSPGATALIRSVIGALVALPVGLIALRGRWRLIRANLGLLIAYGILGGGGAQYCYFMAVQRMQVGPALLIEYTAPAAVVLWMWLRHGQRPTRITVIGAALAATGLVLVLNLLGGADLSLAGVGWALAAMACATTYFVMNADASTGLPAVTLAAGGLLIGSIAVGLLGLVGLLPMTVTTQSPVLAGHHVAWWLPILLLGVVTSGVAYLTGVAAGRLLGARLGAFVALFEVVVGVLFAWLLLGELPGPVQLLGGVLILAGVVAVKLGERR